MALKWEDPPVTGPVVYSRDVFDKFTLAPTMKELYAFLQSDDVKVEESCDNNADGPSSERNASKCAEASYNSGSAEPMNDSKQTPNNIKTEGVRTEKKPFPEPLVPYPCYTSINVKKRKAYFALLNNKSSKVSKQIPEGLRNEVTEFMKYLQEVSRTCADSYNYTPLGGSRYCEEYFTACLEYIKSFPQFYSIQEITSLTSVKFVCELSLNFEKQLLAMGKIDMIEKKLVPENTQLAGDYETVSSVIPPAKKASCLHTPISTDNNAEKLASTYEPQVCLSKEAFLRLLNNDCEFTEAWEVPVWVRTNTARGGSHSTTAYIDPPLLKTEMSWRDRNLLLHEESVKLALKKTVSRPVFFLTTEEISLQVVPSLEEKITRSVVAFDDTNMDFEADLTDLESFGESCKSSIRVKSQKEPNKNQMHKTCIKPDAAPSQLASSPTKPTGSPDPKKDTLVSQDSLDSTAAEVHREADMSSTEESGLLFENTAYEEKPLKEVSEDKMESLTSVLCPPNKRPRQMMENNSDSDDDRLVIDHASSPKVQTRVAAPPPAPQVSLPQVPDPVMSTPANPLVKGTKKGLKRQRISGDCDQLGQILKMQEAMMKPTPSKNQEPPKAQVAEDKPPEPKTYSLVKPCVTSYLESREGQDEGATMSTVVPVLGTPQKKRLLKEDLQVSAEDECDYDPPAEGSVLYKLYSLRDILLMVRSSVQFAHPRHDKETFRAVPVHVLPKLEYQLCYGAECLTHSEACQLWAEKLLHSSTVSFISRINAHTSQVAETQELEDDWIQNISCNFQPARCLNTLYHLVKKVSTLQEGRYLLVHKPREGFVTIFKATDGNKVARGVYNLQTVHCGPPAVPLGVPWVPVDPLHVLPFHQMHKRPPCTFPPRPPPQAKNKAIRGPDITQTGSTAPANQNQAPKKKNRQKQSWQKNVRVKLINDSNKNQNRKGDRNSS